MTSLTEHQGDGIGCAPGSPPPLTMDFAKLLPLAFVMIAGPQILSAIFLATSENWRRNSAAYIAGAALSITAFVTIAYVVGSGLSDAGASGDTLDIVVLVLLVAAALYTFIKRKQ